jgi:hypothetical protein
MHISLNLETDWCLVNVHEPKQEPHPRIHAPQPQSGQDPYPITAALTDLTWNWCSQYSPTVTSNMTLTPLMSATMQAYQTRKLWIPVVKYAWYHSFSK